MKVYAFIGDSGQTIVLDNFNYQPQGNEVLMVSERPEGNYIAKADGTWQEYTPAVVTTNEERLTALEAEINQLDTQYREDKEQLLEYYTEFLIRGDTEGQQAIKDELTALDNQYDTDVEALSEERGM